MEVNHKDLSYFGLLFNFIELTLFRHLSIIYDAGILVGSRDMLGFVEG